jgi:hypothetical protein
MPPNPDGHFLTVHFHGRLAHDALNQEKVVSLKLFAGGSRYILLQCWGHLGEIARDYILPALAQPGRIVISEGWGNMRFQPDEYQGEKIVISLAYAEFWSEPRKGNFICRLGDARRCRGAIESEPEGICQLTEVA